MVLEDFAQTIADMFIQVGSKSLKIINAISQNELHHIGRWKCNYCDFIAETKVKLIEHKRLLHPIPKNGMTGKKAWNSGLTAKTDPRLAKSRNTLKQRYASGELVSPTKGKLHTEEEKKQISESRKKYLQEHPDKVPYLLNHSSKMSYPEKYFMDLFKNEDIPLSYHKQIRTLQNYK